MGMGPNLGDVAKAAKVSSTTVSRYLNGSIKLPQDTTERIDAAVAALRYQPHPHARSLSRGRSDTIGLLLPDIANPFFARLAAAVEAAADAEGLGVMLCSTLNRPGREVDYLARLRRNLVDGLLFATNHPDDGTLAKAINESRGVVLLDEDVEGTTVSKVFSDNQQGGVLAAAHLLEAGHRKLAYVGGPSGLMSSLERGRGFGAAVRDAGPDCAVVFEAFGDYSRAHGEATMRDILDRHPDATAVFAGSDEILIGLLTVLRERGLRVGPDMSVLTFDDAGPLALLDPPITAIRQPIDAIGVCALRLVAALSDGTAEHRVERLPVTLVARASVAPPRPASASKRGTQSSKRKGKNS